MDLSRSRTNRVRLPSPARRASEATGKFEEAIDPEDGPSAALAVPVPEHSNAAAHNSTLPSKTR
jgi:hypothetical protein